MPAIQTIVTFLLVLSVLVLAHELGHFVVAKRAGIKVQEFGFGYPPRIFGVRIGETLYSINLLPLGGFVKMLGENGSPTEPGSFSSKSKLTRAAVLIAGSTMNLVLTPLLLSAALMVGEPVPCEECDRVQVYTVTPGSPAAEAGLRERDIFVSLDGRPIRQLADVQQVVGNAGEREIPAVVLRDGQESALTLTPRTTPEGRPMIGIQLGPEIVTVQRPFWEAVPLGIQQTGMMLRTFFSGIVQMVAREVPADLAGPVGIAQMTGQAARAGWTYVLQFTAILSLNLAVLNMLPIPGLDGARLAFVIVEGIRGRRVNPQTEGVIHFIGLMLLLTLMVYVSVNDVRRLIPS
ncbi:MAG TPA: RIP metalloprotease RseP [Chloroflexota bacterium]|jgi:regulator of sigma E protease|nr:RIP metalloprotease RseP [Chloroflexota bacterium]